MAFGFLEAAAAISAAISAYSAYSAYETGEAQATQTKYDAEYDAQLKRNQKRQEEMNRAEGRRIERKQADYAQRKRMARLAASGGEIGESAITALSGQAAIDEINIQNANLLSSQRAKGLGLAATQSLIAGRSRARGFRAAGRGAAIQGVGNVAGSLSNLNNPKSG